MLKGSKVEQREVFSVVLNCPIAIKEVINLGNALHAGKTTIKEVTNEIDDEEASVEEEQIQKKKVLSLINRIRKGEEQHSNSSGRVEAQE